LYLLFVEEENIKRGLLGRYGMGKNPSVECDVEVCIQTAGFLFLFKINR